MKKTVLLISTVLLSLSHAFSQSDDKIFKISKDILGNIQSGQSEKAISYFDETMKKNLTADALNNIWTGLGKQLGGFVANGETTTDNYKEYRIVYTVCNFKNDKLKFKAVFNKSDQLSGMFFIPANQK